MLRKWELHSRYLIGLLALLWMCLAQQCGRDSPGPSPAPPVAPGMPLPHRRPYPEMRTFASPAVERHLHALLRRTWRDPDMATLLWNCLPNTLDTTVTLSPQPGQLPDTFIITGDNKAMWLRDSACQIEPYIRFAAEEPDGIGALVRGLIHRHTDSVLLDPYANSFVLVGASCPQHNQMAESTRLDSVGNPVSALSMGLADRKFEKDSLLYVLRLGRLYFNRTRDARPFEERWRKAVQTILDTLRSMQRPLTPLNFSKAPYTYQQTSKEPKDTLDHGIGKPHRYTGMVRGAFLPSDDAYKLPYHVPGNAMAVVELRGTAGLLRTLNNGTGDIALATELEALAEEVDDGVKRFGIVTHSSGVKVYAQVVDGFGNYFFGDDANVPSLLSLPYLGYVGVEDSIYLATRKLLLSNATNPYFTGPSSLGYEGIGSEDASGKFGGGWIWHISLMMRAFTATADAEIFEMLKQLRETAPDGLMHESFWFENPTNFTRAWFGWANSLFGNLLLHLVDERPHLLFTDGHSKTVDGFGTGDSGAIAV